MKKIFFGHDFGGKERKKRYRDIVKIIAAKNDFEVIFGEADQLQTLLSKRDLQGRNDWFYILRKALKKCDHWIVDLTGFQRVPEDSEMPDSLNLNVLLELGLIYGLHEKRVDVFCHEDLRPVIRTALSNLSGLSPTFSFYKTKEEFKSQLESAISIASKVLGSDALTREFLSGPSQSYSNSRFRYFVHFPDAWMLQTSTNGDGVKVLDLQRKGIDLRVFGHHVIEPSLLRGSPINGKNLSGYIKSGKEKEYGYFVKAIFPVVSMNAEIVVWISSKRKAALKRYMKTFEFIAQSLFAYPYEMKEKSISVDGRDYSFLYQVELVPTDPYDYDFLKISSQGLAGLMFDDFYGLKIPEEFLGMNTEQSDYFLVLRPAADLALVVLFSFGTNPGFIKVISLTNHSADIVLDRPLKILELRGMSDRDKFRLIGKSSYSECISLSPEICSYDPCLVYSLIGNELVINESETRAYNEEHYAQYGGFEFNKALCTVKINDKRLTMTWEEARKFAKPKE